MKHVFPNMAQATARIVTTEDVLGGEPRLDGRRISVLQVAEPVVTGEYVADQFDISLAEVHCALTYYYEHPDEMAELRIRDEDVRATLRERSETPGTDTE